ncbi:glycoside hydrolase family protein [Hymenobacter chitinivorans]|uniref:Glycosyl hydrolase family 43 n=1 Tax=Hymenobacter chitinivorans DSM 11115 TaxID=1121954 RepID=A0A2M9BPR9_9BACT|nr:family 43 glycosylhydrolase [Hymenobacter chitinivorans]PJJ59949.1 glycosyl hydrolase family 43 [Hymenobacter chitinivorans DSM 11115]
MKYLVFLLVLLLPLGVRAQTHPPGQLAPKPLFRDPVYDGAADPVVIWNKSEQKWWMFYTNRRATDTTATGVTWVHGTRIGIAESADSGATWRYRDTANINYRPTPQYTHWAPDVVEDKGTYHMFLTYVPGVFADWNHPRQILHLTSPDLLNWQYVSTLALATDKVIDASVYRLPDGTWRLWYNNERDGKSIYYADSPDLTHWQDKGPALKERGEGPKVFRWQGQYWLIIDQWRGLAVYRSPDLKTWTPQPERLLALPGTGPEDQAIGGHCDVVVRGDGAYLFYFTHPARRPGTPSAANRIATRRSLIQVVELHYADGKLTGNRDEPTYMQLGPGGKRGRRR